MGNVSGSGSLAVELPPVLSARPEEDELSNSLQKLSLRGRQLFSTQMGDAGGQLGAKFQRGEKRPLSSIPSGVDHKDVRRADKEHEGKAGESSGESSDTDDETSSDDDGQVQAVVTTLGMTPGSQTNKKKNRGAWTPEQDAALKIAVERHEGKNWKAIAKEVPGNRSHIQCLQRWGKVLKPGLVKGPWTEEEDDLLRSYVPLEARGNWVAVAEHIPGRTAKQCRERWSLCLDPAIKKEPWSAEEDDYLLHLHDIHGNAWAKIAKELPGRTENATKSRFKSIERKRDRAWTLAEDETIIKGKSEERKWSVIASMLPKSSRTKHAVKIRWKELMEINPALKRFDSGKSRSTSSSEGLNNRTLQKDDSMNGSGDLMPSFTQMAAVAAASTPPEMDSTTVYIPMRPTTQLAPPMYGDSSPPHTNHTVLGDTTDESGSFPSVNQMLDHTLSSDKLMNMRIQRNESFEEWLAREAGGIAALPIMGGTGIPRSYSEEQLSAPFNFAYDDLNDLELV